MFNVKLSSTNASILNSFLYIFFAGIISFLIGFIHHKYFFIVGIHSDAVAYYTLAQAMVEEQNILVNDFIYGNQLIILRSSIFIAVALLCGFVNYDAYIVGSSLSVSFYGILLYLFLNTYFNDKNKSTFFLFLLLIPISLYDYDIVLGQQSHLSNIILCFGSVIFFLKYIEDNNSLKYLLLSCICLFFVGIESPIRLFLVLIPILLCIIFLKNKRLIKNVFFYYIILLIIAVLFNKLLLCFYKVPISHFGLTFVGFSDILKNLFKIMIVYNFSDITNLNYYASKKINYFIFYYCAIIIIIGYITILYSSTVRLKNLLTNAILKRIIYNKNFIYVIAITGFYINSLLIITFNPDSPRHLFWCLFIFKFLLLNNIFRFLNIVCYKLKLNKIFPKLIISILVIICSSYVAIGSVNKMKMEKIANNGHKMTANIIKNVADKYEIRYIYGNNFWKMVVLNVFNDLNYVTLVGENVFPFLVRPSMYCRKPNENVIYYLKNNNNQDNELKERLKQQPKSFEAQVGIDYSIWVGNPIWKIPEYCKNITSNK